MMEPWRVYKNRYPDAPENNVLQVVDANGKVIVDLSEWPWTEAEQTACLIAMAPAMRNSLENIMREILRLLEDGEERVPDVTAETLKIIADLIIPPILDAAKGDGG